jgi:nucleoside phosphorylase
MRLNRLRRSFLRIIAAAFAICVFACGSDDSGGSVESPPPLFAVLSAFPAELAALLERATVGDTTTIEGRTFRNGELGGVAVILGMTGIGLVNATATTRALLERVEVAGVVISGVAGSPFRIGDVTVPERWALPGGTAYAARPEWIELATEISSPGTVALERCTERPDTASEDEVCLPHEPAIVVGGSGESSDPFDDTPVPCQPDSGDVFGCDVESPDATPSLLRGQFPTKTLAVEDPEVPVAVDMETAAIAAEAIAHGVPFIAFRAVSDGEGDPLGLPGFPAQFFVYYRLAASNAAAATTAFFERVSATAPSRP